MRPHGFQMVTHIFQVDLQRHGGPSGDVGPRPRRQDFGADGDFASAGHPPAGCDRRRASPQSQHRPQPHSHELQQGDTGVHHRRPAEIPEGLRGLPGEMRHQTKPHLLRSLIRVLIKRIYRKTAIAHLYIFGI